MRFNAMPLALALFFSTLSLQAQQPAVLHAQFAQVPARGGLTVTLAELERNPAPAWVGYAVPVAAKFTRGGYGGSISFLEGGDRHEGYSRESQAAFDHVNILMRLAGGQVEKLRIESPDRTLDAGDLRFTWLSGVAAEDSVHVLELIARGNGPARLREDAVFSISLHDSPAATPALAELAAPGNSSFIREKAAFWLASQRGHEGFLVVARLAHDDDAQLRVKIAFDLTLTHDPAAVDTLIGMARNDASPEVRKQAQFWMASLGGKKIASELRTSAERDPQEDNRRSAVFALSRLPGEEATMQLIQLARTSSDPEVRKQAVFWLGQSTDPKATDFLAQLLQSK